MCGITHMNRVRTVCVEVVWTYGENGRGSVG